MLKKLCALFTSALLCIMLVSSVNVSAAVTDRGMTHASATSKEEANKSMEELNEKWNALSTKQKADIYKSLKATVDAQGRFLDKLVKYELMSGEDADLMKTEMNKRFNEMKDNNSLFNAKPNAPAVKPE